MAAKLTLTRIEVCKSASTYLRAEFSDGWDYNVILEPGTDIEFVAHQLHVLAANLVGHMRQSAAPPAEARRG
jgi:hypothetical protein